MGLSGTIGTGAVARARSRIEVMIVDDSAVVRQVLGEVLRADPGIDVICAVADPLLAIERMKIRWPQVIVLDVEMPRMDGLTFLRKIMSERPTPVVICSTLTESGAATTLEALAAGAVSIVTKPKLGTRRFIEDSSGDLISVVKAAAQANVRRLVARAQSNNATPVAVQPKLSVDAILPATETRAMQQTTERVVAIGTSTGGTQALEEVLVRMPRGCAGIVIVQHMPEKFTAAFAARLNSICEIEVREATHGERLLPGHALIAPGGRHMALRRSGAYYYIDVIDGPLVNRHRPSVDVLFRSTARCAGANALGIIMTGMGDDGARGLKEMREAGSFTVAQDEASCVVFGMPKEAIRLGGAQRVMPLPDVPRAIVDWGNGVLRRAEAS
jgi:two-component system chemotaxis response regulator CheB